MRLVAVKVRARAYSSSANLGPGFDTLGIALDAFFDEIIVWENSEGRIVVEEIAGPYSGLVRPNRNTAARAVREFLLMTGRQGIGVSMRIWKGVPPGRGLGSSGASAAAAVRAVAGLLGMENIPVSLLVKAAGLGESESSGNPHYDNVAASILGGLAVVSVFREEVSVTRLDVEAFFAVGVPFVSVPENKTGAMRRVLPESIGFHEHVANSQRLAMLIAGLVNRDYRLAGKAMDDLVVTPRRSVFIPCYEELKKAAFNSGGFGFTISGAGPSVIALAESERAATEVAKGFSEVYSECGVNHLSITAKPAPGAFIM